MTKLLQLLSIIALASFLSGCGESHDHAGGSQSGHHHEAPHGGTLVELGEHQNNVEFVLDAATGTMTAYVLDGHAENFIRISSGSWKVEAKVGEKTAELSFTPQANAATGEIIGNTSQFVAQADWLKTAKEFAGTIKELEIRGNKFANVGFKFPK